MKKWIMIPMLSGVLLVGNSAAPSADVRPSRLRRPCKQAAVTAAKMHLETSAEARRRRRPAGGVPVSASAFPLPPPGANFIMRRTSNGADPQAGNRTGRA